MSCLKIVVISSDNVCLDVKYSATCQHVLQDATHYMTTHNSIVFTVPHSFQALQSKKVFYTINLTSLSHYVAEKRAMTDDVKALLTDYIGICMFHSMTRHPTTKVNYVSLKEEF